MGKLFRSSTGQEEIVPIHRGIGIRGQCSTLKKMKLSAFNWPIKTRKGLV